MLKRWHAFTLFLDDGRICMSNNAAERGLRRVATGSFIVHLIFKCLETLEVARQIWSDTGVPFRAIAAVTACECRSLERI